MDKAMGGVFKARTMANNMWEYDLVPTEGDARRRKRAWE